MRTHVALLRGVNVGGRNKVAMADLRQVVTSLGYADVATYIQSGNIVFTSPETDSTRLAVTLDRQIADSLGVRARVVVLSTAELDQVIVDNPYSAAADPTRVHAFIRRESLTPDELAALSAAMERARGRGGVDEVTVVGRALFLHTPKGFGRSELAAWLSADRAATARNWRTVLKLRAMLAA